VNPAAKRQNFGGGKFCLFAPTKSKKSKTINVQRLFVQVPENAPENVDLVVKRESIEVGPEGEKVDVDDYQYQWEKAVQSFLDADPLIKKIKSGQELTDAEVEELARKLNTPEFYFNEANLRAAYQYPQGTLAEFIKAALKIYDLPTEEQLQEKKIDDLFESWLLTKNFNSQQAKIMRMIKSQYLANKEKVDIAIFNQPLFSQFGG
jgi:type I restriction enzyme R subunit